jgi:inosine-uridine nucleoside N-ribohydrolase
MLGGFQSPKQRMEMKMDNRNSFSIFCLTFLMLFIVGCNVPASTPTVTHTFTPALPTSPLITTAPSTLAVEPTKSPDKLLLIYDDDGSRDGMAALLYLLSYPDISIQAITISYGEAHPNLYIQHVGRVLDNFGIGEVPLGAGQDMPLAGGGPFPNWLRHLSDNFWDYPLPDAGKTYPFQNAPELMVSIIDQASEPVTIFLSGPFTNLAQALLLDPSIKKNISAVYFMGGAVYVPGNITNLIPSSNNRVAEWNILADPQAAEEVFESGLELYMIPLDATNKVLFSQGDVHPWHKGGEKADMVADLYDIMFNSFGFKKTEIFDLTAAAIMVNPQSCNFQPLHLDVMIDDGPALGQTTVVPNTEPNIYACLQPNADQVKHSVNEAFSP